jgi:uncharacterized protein
MLADLLKQVLDIKGITSAAVVSGEGFIVEGASKNDKDLGFVGGVIASGLASSRVLGELLGEGDISQAMIEYEEGPVLLMPLTSGEEGYVMVTMLDSINSLGRARFQLRKVLPEIAQAVSA